MPDTKRRPLRRPHSPASLVVKEEDKEKPLVSPGLHALARLQHGQRRGRDGDPVVVARHTWHLGVDDLPDKDTLGHVEAHTAQPCRDSGPD